MEHFDEEALVYAAQVAKDLGWHAHYNEEIGALEITSNDYSGLVEISGGGTPMIHMLRDDGQDILEPIGTHMDEAKPLIEYSIRTNLTRPKPINRKPDPTTKEGDPREWGLNMSKDYAQYQQGGT